jgi:hypothetical protein
MSAAKSSATPEIVSVDRLEKGLVVSFSEGTTVLYKTDFLWENRDYDGNHAIEEDPEQDEPVDSV